MWSGTGSRGDTRWTCWWTPPVSGWVGGWVPGSSCAAVAGACRRRWHCAGAMRGGRAAVAGVAFGLGFKQSCAVPACRPDVSCRLASAGKEWTDFVHREDELVTVVSGERTGWGPVGLEQKGALRSALGPDG